MNKIIKTNFIIKLIYFSIVLTILLLLAISNVYELDSEID